MDNKEDWVRIPEFPKYFVNRKTGAVWSTYVDRILKPCDKAYRNGENGYRLWSNGIGKFLSVKTIMAFVARNELRRIRNEMAAINTGTPTTNDFIIGSVNKLTGVFSNTDFPARHPSLSVARKEAARLAQNHRERKFVVLEVKGVVSVDEVKWE